MRYSLLVVPYGLVLLGAIFYPLAAQKKMRILVEENVDKKNEKWNLQKITKVNHQKLFLAFQEKKDKAL